MLVPSIDLMNTHAVQLVGGDPERLEFDAGDPRPLAIRFGRVGEVAVIDLDAALGRGSNADTIADLLPLARCRVGGGIRDLDTARRWLDAGAAKIILGTAATPDLLSKLPRDRLIAAVDARHDKVVIHGWTQGEGSSILDKIAELRAYVGGFLVTFVELEGRLGGTDLARAKAVVQAAGEARVTIAGGVTTAEEIAALDALGADAQVGMALYSGRLPLADAFAAPLVTDRPDGLWPTVVVDESGQALGLAYSSAQSLAYAIKQGVGAYYSRSRGGLWIKGATSGDTQDLLRIDQDCDRDTLRFTVCQRGTGFCHTGTRSCWGPVQGLHALARTLALPKDQRDPASYTTRLLNDSALLAAKLREEADELTRAQSRDEVIHEAADLLYFTLVRLASEGIDLSEIERHLDLRSLKISRRIGDAKPGYTQEHTP